MGGLIAGYGLPFVVIVYLSLRGGGYDEVVRSEAGIVIWAVVAVGAIAGLVPRLPLNRRSWIALGALAALLAWTLASMAWSESAERGFQEVARVACYLGILALGISLQGRDGLRRMAMALAAAIALVSALALLSRLHPAWFPADQAAETVPAIRGRLNYPLNYWNGLSTLVAMGIPLVVAAAVDGRRLAVRTLATAMLPVMALTMYFTFSRSGWVELAAALVVLIAIHPRRFAALGTLLLGTLGTAAAIALASRRDALEAAAGSSLAHDQGIQMIFSVLLICAFVAAIRVGLEIAEQRALLPSVPVMSISRRQAGVAAAAVAVVVVVATIGFDVPGRASNAWTQFKSPSNIGAGAGRFTNVSGNGRYQYWQSAIDASASAPVNGIGAGTYEFWWARHSSSATPGFINTAHSLYLETLGELGIVGLALVLAPFGVIVVAGARRARWAPDPDREMIAGGLALCAAFVIAMAVDWGWDLVPIPAAVLLMGAAFLCDQPASEEGDAEAVSSPRPSRRDRLGLLGFAVPSLAILVVSLVGAVLIHRSQDASDGPDLDSALSDARSAASVQPWAATPHLQEALVLELQKDYPAAAAQAREATDKESTNWRTWYTLARIQREAGNPAVARASYERARSLNPISPIFAEGQQAQQ